jgi:hypothetical protein
VTDCEPLSSLSIIWADFPSTIKVQSDTFSHSVCIFTVWSGSRIPSSKISFLVVVNLDPALLDGIEKELLRACLSHDRVKLSSGDIAIVYYIGIDMIIHDSPSPLTVGKQYAYSRDYD